MNKIMEYTWRNPSLLFWNTINLKSFLKTPGKIWRKELKKHMQCLQCRCVRQPAMCLCVHNWLGRSKRWLPNESFCSGSPHVGLIHLDSQMRLKTVFSDDLTIISY